MLEIDFIDLVKKCLTEQNLTTEDLFKNNVIRPHTFYKYHQQLPSIPTVFRIANYLSVSLDYLLEFDTENHFTPYTYNHARFHQNFWRILKQKHISGRKFCRDVGFSPNVIARWKNGATPALTTIIATCKYLSCSPDDLL